MYRVVIVDDEEPVLDSFGFLFRKYIKDFTLCGKARSGTEAVKEIKDKNPDVVFMDIQMPGMDGIEAIRQLRPLFPQVIFILATAYERFDIAQKAIPLGVFSYLVKPVSRAKILEELDKVKQELDTRKREQHTRLEDEQFLEKTRDESLKQFLTGLIWKNPDEEAWNDFCHLFGINSEGASVCLLGGLNSVSEGIRRDLYKALIQKIQYKFHVLYTELGDKMILFFPDEGVGKDQDKQLRQIVNEHSAGDLTLGIGGFCRYSELSRSVTEAFLPFGDAENSRSDHNRDPQNMSSLCREILRCERSKGEELFENFWVEVFKKDEFNVAKGKMVALFTLLLHDIENNILIRSQLNLDPSEQIMPLKTMDEWRPWAASAKTSLFDLLDLQKSQAYPQPLKKALAYIAQNYDQQIHLTSVAGECSVSSSYLSRLFSEHLDTTFIDYVNRYRVNQAIFLLRDKDISIKEASFRVGYQNPNYFSRIFRKIMGISPSDIGKRSSQ